MSAFRGYLFKVQQEGPLQPVCHAGKQNKPKRMPRKAMNTLVPVQFPISMNIIVTPGLDPVIVLNHVQGVPLELELYRGNGFCHHSDKCLLQQRSWP